MCVLNFSINQRNAEKVRTLISGFMSLHPYIHVLWLSHTYLKLNQTTIQNHYELYL